MINTWIRSTSYSQICRLDCEAEKYILEGSNSKILQKYYQEHHMNVHMKSSKVKLDFKSDFI